MKLTSQEVNIDCILLHLFIVMQLPARAVKIWQQCCQIGSVKRFLLTGNASCTAFLRIFLQQPFPSDQKSIQD
jgi:hypothetical protein